jgi:hypothetical protein
MSLERGSKEGNLHIQATSRIKMPRTEAGKRSLKDLFRKEIPIMTGEGVKIGVSFFGETQTWTGMLGYIHKDAGRPHFELHLNNVLPEDIEAGLAEYASYTTNYTTAKRVLNKTNMHKEVEQHYSKFFRLLFALLSPYHSNSLFLSGPSRSVSTAWCIT